MFVCLSVCLFVTWQKIYDFCQVCWSVASVCVCVCVCACVCVGVCVCVCVCLFALLHLQLCLDLAENLCTCTLGSKLEVIQFWGTSLQGQGHENRKIPISQHWPNLIAYNSMIDTDILTKLDGPKDIDTLAVTHEFHSDCSNHSTVTAL